MTIKAFPTEDTENELVKTLFILISIYTYIYIYIYI